MKNYEFMILAATDEKVYGYGVNHKNTVQWVYYFETGVIDLYKSIAAPPFYDQLKRFLVSEKDTITRGVYQPSQERKDDVIEWLSFKEIAR